MFPPTTRILIVDDSPTARQIIVGILRSIGLNRFDQASDGKEAADLLMAANAAGDDYGLGIFDWKMPIMDGLQLIKFVRISSQNPQMPVLMMTAEGDTESIFSAVKAGVDGYVLKPINAGTLLEKLQAISARRASQHAALTPLS
jgi:DNA-binding response OmpR family regulator